MPKYRSASNHLHAHRLPHHAGDVLVAALLAREGELHSSAVLQWVQLHLAPPPHRCQPPLPHSGLEAPELSAAEEAPNRLLHLRLSLLLPEAVPANLPLASVLRARPEAEGVHPFWLNQTREDLAH